MKIPYHELPNDNEPKVTYHVKEIRIGDDRRIRAGRTDCGKVGVWIERDLPDGNTSLLEFGLSAEAANVLALLLIDALEEIER